MSIDLKGQIDDVLKGSVELLTGGSANIQSKTIYENGTYNPPSGVDGFAPVIVDVPTSEPVIESKTITENGTYNPPSGVDGFAPVVVNVPVPTILPVTLTENGTYTNYEGNGFNPITVAVPTVQKMTNSFNQTVGGSMIITYKLSGIDIVWNGGDSIPCTLSSIQSIKSASKLDVILTTGTSYYNTYGAHPVRELYIGLTSTYIAPGTAPTSVTWLELQQEHDDNTTYTFSFDLTEIDSQDIFIYISANGWNISDMQLLLS